MDKETLLNKPRKDIKGLIINNDGNLDNTSTRLRKTPKTHKINTHNHIKGNPEIGSIITAKIGNNIQKVVVVSAEIAYSKSIITKVVESDPIFAFTGDYLSDPKIIKQYISFMRKQNWDVPEIYKKYENK